MYEYLLTFSGLGIIGMKFLLVQVQGTFPMKQCVALITLQHCIPMHLSNVFAKAGSVNENLPTNLAWSSIVVLFPEKASDMRRYELVRIDGTNT